MLRDKWGGVRWLSFSELLKHEASELKCWHLNFKWEEMLVNTGLFSAVGQLPQISMFSFFSFYCWVNYNAECQSSSLLNFHLDGTLPNVSSIFFLYLHTGLEQKILQKCPFFFSIICSMMPDLLCATSFHLLVFTVLQLSGSMLIFKLLAAKQHF